jgi:hypothetical protein
MPSATTAPAKLGSIQVQPATVQPGQPVLIQVLDTSGHPYAKTFERNLQL